MKAVVWHGTEDVRVDQVPDPVIEKPTDAIVRGTSTAICGSDLHLYRVLMMYMDEGDVLGHEPMGIVEEVGSDVPHIRPGDRVVVPFNIACGHCFMCGHGLQSECETTARRYGAETIGWSDNVAAELLKVTGGRGTDSVIDAVGTEAHGAPVQELMQKVASRSPARLATALMERVGSDRTSALHTAISSVRRGGTLSIIGVYGPGAQLPTRAGLMSAGERLDACERFAASYAGHLSLGTRAVLSE